MQCVLFFFCLIHHCTDRMLSRLDGTDNAWRVSSLSRAVPTSKSADYQLHDAHY